MEVSSCKTAIFVVSTILAGIFSGTFVVEITTSAGIVWQEFYRSRSFYVLLGITYFIYKYSKEIISYEKNILKFKDREYCIAYVRSKCIPEAADMYRTLINDGKVDELEQAMREVRRLLR